MNTTSFNMKQYLRVVANVTCHESGLPVYFKLDGERFEQVHTVKLNTDSEYDFKFTLKPGINVK